MKYDMVIYDVSAVIMSCMFSSSKGMSKWNYYSYPTSGIGTLFSNIITDLKTVKPENIYLCLDGKNNFRKKFYPDYKATRKAKRLPVHGDIFRLQIEFLKDWAGNLGVSIVEFDDVEADDLIYSIVYENRDKKILLRADDSDLQETGIINPNLTMRSIQGRGEIRCRRTLEGKIIHGDTSDNIPAIVMKKPEQDLFLKLRNENTINMNVYKNKEYLLSVGLPIGLVEQIYRNAVLVMPVILRDIDKYIIKGTQNLYKVEQMFALLGMKKIASRMNMTDLKQDKTTRNYFIKMLSKIPPSVVEYFSKDEYVGDTTATTSVGIDSLKAFLQK